MEADEQRAAQGDDTGPVPDATDQSPEEFAQTIESDEAYEPSNEELKREKGG